jgi:hypothetical protein
MSISLPPIVLRYSANIDNRSSTTIANYFKLAAYSTVTPLGSVAWQRTIEEMDICNKPLTGSVSIMGSTIIICPSNAWSVLIPNRFMLLTRWWLEQEST